MMNSTTKREATKLSTYFYTAVAVLMLAIPAFAQVDNSHSTVKRGSELHKLVHFDLSPALRDIPPAPRNSSIRRVVPNRPIKIDSDTNRPVTDGGLDSVIQMTPGFSAPTSGANYMGVGNGFSGPQGSWTVNVAPPDTVMDIGSNHIVQAVNSGFAILNKTGTVLYGPVNINTIWSGFGGGCQTNNDGDPTINYDQMADRWMVAQFAVSTTPYLECIAISQTSDPTGAWYRYSYSFGTTNFNDYPHVGVWPDGYYITYNIFGATSFGQVCAYNRTKLLNGTATASDSQCFSTGSNVQGLLASDMDGATQPPAGSPNYVLRFGTNQLQMWKFHVDWTTPANSTFTGPTNIAVAGFTASCSTSTRGACVPQANGGTSYYLESLADRLMNRIAYRNFGDHEALTVAHSIGGQTAANVRWYELRSPNATPTVFQSGSYAPDTSWRWVASTAMDQQGNMAMGYSVSSSTISPTIRVTGRLAADAAGTMGTETDILGSIAHASQIGTYGTPAKPLQRWGDYSAMVVDPTDDCTFWYTTEYVPTQGIFNWATRIASFKFSSCGGVVDTTPPTTSLTAPSAGATLSGTATVSANASDNIGVTRVDFFAGATQIGTDSTSPYSIGWDTTAVANGSYSLTSKAFDAANNSATSAGVSVTVSNAAPTGIVNGTFETGTLSGWTAAGTTAVLSGTVHGGTYADRNGSTVATNGDSNIVQTFTVPSGGGTVSFWYKMTCPDTVTYDWVTATLVDNTTATTTTLLAKTCATNASFVQVTSAALTAGHSVTVTLTSHDDNYAGDPSYAYFDDVVFSAGGGDTTAPTTSITAPSAGATVVSTIAVNANASDNIGVTKVDFYLDGTTLLGTDTTSPYSINWNTTTASNGAHSLTSKATDAANNVGTSASVSVTVSNGAAALTATYSATYKAPACVSGGKSCGSASLLTGRGTMSPAELNQPNTINNSCADGASGTFHSDESLDSLSVATNDTTALAGGKLVTVSATVWCWGTADSVDLYYTSNATTPSWTLIGTQACTVAGAKTFTATYTLPVGATQAVRGTFRYNGTASACGTNSGYDDHDDLVFGVQ